MLAVLVGGAIGFLLERLAPLLGGPADLEGRLVFLGVVDGAMAVLYRLSVRNRQLGRIGRLGGMVLMMLTFALFALKAFGFAWMLIGANAGIGAVLGWFLFPGDGAELPEP